MHCLWRTAAKQLAEDVTAAAFLEAWRKRRRLRLRTESALPLLLGVATEVLRNYWRSQHRHARAIEQIRRADQLPWDEGELVARVDAMGELREAAAAVRALPQREREVVALIAWGELSPAETAAALRIPVATVRSRLVRHAVVTPAPGISLLQPEDSTLAARRRALEASCRRRATAFPFLDP